MKNENKQEDQSIGVIDVLKFIVAIVGVGYGIYVFLKL